MLKFPLTKEPKLQPHVIYVLGYKKQQYNQEVCRKSNAPPPPPKKKQPLFVKGHECSMYYWHIIMLKCQI